MFNYAQLDENNICIGVQSSTVPVISSSLIKLEAYDESVVGKLYENNEFVTNTVGDEIAWRNSELEKTDKIASVPDYPNYYNYIEYRKALRDWPASNSFPDTRPVLDLSWTAYTHREFYAIITDAVLGEILAGKSSDPVLAIIKDKFDNADVIFSNDPDLATGLQYLLSSPLVPSMTQSIIDQINTGN